LWLSPLIATALQEPLTGPAKVEAHQSLRWMASPQPEPADSPSILIVAALAEELDHPGVLHTGVGKLNAAYVLTRELQRRRPKLVVN
jgi:hypothetical protein